MKKLAKRLAAVLVAAVMTVGISMTAFADEGEGTTTPTTTTGSATLTVNGAGLWDPAQGEGQQGKGKTVTAIRMFNARFTAGESDAANNFDSYELESKWYPFFRETTRVEAMKAAGVLATDANTKDDSVINSAAVAYIQYLDKQKTMPTLAHNAQVWARTNLKDDTTITQTATATNVKNDDPTMGSATFTGLNVGYYLVYPQMGSTGTNNRGTDAMLVNVPEKNGNTSVDIKSAYPTVDKKVKTTENGELAQNGTAQVGDDVTFQLHSTVPDMTDYDKYTFAFNDTLSNGLAFDTGSVKVSIGGHPLTKDTDYTVTEPEQNGNKLTVTFKDLKKLVEEDNEISTGADIVVTYTAHITKDATTTNPADNTVTVSYSNNPDGSGTGTSQPSESKVYTYKIDIDKYTGEYDTTNSNNVKRLAGAVFQLEATKNGAAIGLVKESDNVYHVKGDGEKATDTTVTSDGKNKIIIKGLKAGTYYLEEITAPTGYNKLTTPVTIVIATSDEKDATVTMTNAKYTVGENSKVGDSTVAVQNNAGATLPTTGSMGTIGLVALGVAVVLIGVFMPRKKKANH